MSLTVARAGWCGAAFGGAALLVLAGCQGADRINLFKAEGEAFPGDSAAMPATPRDIEAPEAFQATGRGLWDGRPSLGGIWVAHPDVGEPERVIIRNTANSKSVVGALFRRERANPGPVFQVSSDAAAALGLLAGAPAELSVTALRREEPQAVGAVEAGSPDPAVEPASIASTAATEAAPLPALTFAFTAGSATEGAALHDRTGRTGMAEVRAGAD